MIQWGSLGCTEGDDQESMTQDQFLKQHVLEPSRGDRLLDMALSSTPELVNNIEIHEIRFNIQIKPTNKNRAFEKTSRELTIQM